MITLSRIPKGQQPSCRRRAPANRLGAILLSLIFRLLPGTTPKAITHRSQAVIRARFPSEHNMPILPPPFTPLLTTLIGDPRLSAALFRSYARLYAAAWAYAYQCTAALDFESQVVDLLGVGRSQARQHLRLLRQNGLLSWSSDGNSRYIFRFTLPQLTIYPGPDEQPIRAALPPAGGAMPRNASGSPSLLAAQSSAQPSSTRTPKQMASAAESGSPDSSNPDHGGVGVNLINPSLNQDRFKQQQPGSAKSSENISAAQSSPPDPIYSQVLEFLRRAGVWSKTAERLAQQITANKQSGDAELPDTGDVLGWMAYCFADQESNQISNPAAVLAANLTNNRPCPATYRPPLICDSCHRSQEYCRCKPGKAEYGYPPEFLEPALKSRKKYSTYADRWGVCMYCHAIPCQCE